MIQAPPAPAPETPDLSVPAIRGRLLSLGFTDRPCAELEAIAERSADPREVADAARELALWHMRARTPQGWRAALRHARRARQGAVDPWLGAGLAVAEMLCLEALGRPGAAAAAFEAACLRGEFTTDLALCRANLEPAPEGRVAVVNHAMDHHGVPPLRLLDGAGAPYDRLACAAALPQVPPGAGPRVTVLMATYGAEDTLPTALRSLSEQTWRDLEILVIDDASLDATRDVARAHAARDPRIRVVEMARNGGAYVARNRGLEVATGDLVTLHDADDWSHPIKIEAQVRHMMRDPGAVACFSQQARATPELRFERWTGAGAFLIRNVSSFMFRRAPVIEALGCWDSVRFAADMEFVRRAERAFGRRAVVDLPTGPHSFQRDGETSVIADDVMGMNGFYYGVRREYYDAQRHHHAAAESLRYDPDPDRRAFPVPDLMRPDRAERRAARAHVDVVIAGDFREADDALAGTIERVSALRAEGRTVGLVEVHDYDRHAGGMKRMHDDLRALVDGEGVRVLVYGDDVTCDALEGSPGGLPDDRRYLPAVRVRRDGPLRGGST